MERTTEGSPVPPIWPIARRLEGRVTPPACILLVASLGAAALAAGIAGYPLAGILLATLTETVCCASSLSAARLYRFPRFAERLGDASRMLSYMVIILYYASRGLSGEAVVAALALLVLHTGVGGDELSDNIVLASLLSASLLLEVSSLAENPVHLHVLANAALFPILVATGLVVARLIYREATGF